MRKHGMLIPTAELVSVWVKGCGLLAFWSLWFGGLDGRRKEESSRGIVFQLLVFYSLSPSYGQEKQNTGLPS